MSLQFTAEDRTDGIFAYIEQDFVHWLNTNKNKVPKKFHQKIKDMLEMSQDYASEDTLWYLNRAFDEHYSEGCVEVDSNAIVSKGEDPGAYVQAWVWVYDDETKPGYVESEE